MTHWTNLSNEEVERRRQLSIAAMQRRDRNEFEEGYQRRCDEMYWKRGRCCAGCDHWISEAGLSGQCSAAGIMSGHDVMKSMGIESASFIPEPGFPFTKADHVCGLFKDDFDWATLPDDYLEAIGAMENSELLPKPSANIKA